MEQASRGIRAVLSALVEEAEVEKALLQYVRQLEIDYAEVQDITLFVFAVRSFFCWHRAPELAEKPDAVKRIQDAWIAQNDEIYSRWMASMEDDPELLKWSKWTFQAKVSILQEFLADCKRGKAS